MKKLFVGLASVTLAVSAWGQSRAVANKDSRVQMPLAECGEAISHPDSILVQQGVPQHGLNYEEYPISQITTTVLVLRSTAGIRQGYYFLYHSANSATNSPRQTFCYHFGFENIF